MNTTPCKILLILVIVRSFISVDSVRDDQSLEEELPFNTNRNSNDEDHSCGECN
jgi:hypothetical protein